MAGQCSHRANQVDGCRNQRSSDDGLGRFSYSRQSARRWLRNALRLADGAQRMGFVPLRTYPVLLFGTSSPTGRYGNRPQLPWKDGERELQ